MTTTTITDAKQDRQQPQLAVKVKRLSKDAILPTRVHNNDAGWDLYASEDITILAGTRSLVPTQISFEIPDGYVGLIWPRSGLSAKKGIDILAGVIDAGYRGEVSVCLYNSSEPMLMTEYEPGEEASTGDMIGGGYTYYLNREQNAVNIKKGDRVAQILFQEIPHLPLVEVDELNDSHRDTGGFGSSGS